MRKAVPFAAVVLMALPPFALAGERIKLASTTSLDNTGMLAYFLPHFEKKTGIKVDVIATGTGKALKLAENGDVDAVLVHDPVAEESFMKAGFGDKKTKIARNYFIMAGPAGDPAKIGEAATAADAFGRLAKSGNAFVSRGDKSGTHMKELELWKASGAGTPAGKTWYIESGKGMGEALMMADEKQAYVLTDEATFNKMKTKIKLAAVYMKRDEGLLNVYSFITLNHVKFPKAKHKEAAALSAFMASDEGQNLIGAFKDAQGNVLFIPSAERPPIK
jgi:tungstate transport system substrate-binding protein